MYAARDIGIAVLSQTKMGGAAIMMRPNLGLACC